MEIDAVKRFKLLKKMKKVWLSSPDTSAMFRIRYYKTDAYYPFVLADLQTFMIDFLKEKYEAMLARAQISYTQIEFYANCQPYDTVYFAVIDKIPFWMQEYSGKIDVPVDLRLIAENRQNIHTGPVQKKTIDGISLLEAQIVPRNQRTLAEIKAAWLLKKNAELVENCINDMRLWGSRKTVMHRKENKYKNVLRGLWARIKTYEGDMRDELLKRLWEECLESIGKCADGHVGRLVNVLSGFDDTIKLKPTMEYFQNKIALISALDEPVNVKNEKAIELMNEMDMPQEERVAWLEAL